jgi:hypothetical protein
MIFRATKASAFCRYSWRSVLSGGECRPKIFEYLGIIIFFYSNEHEPVHVHGRYGGEESKAEFVIVDGIIVEIWIKPVRGSRPLTGTKLREFEEFLEHFADKIVAKWIDYFVFHKHVEFEIIQRRV